jgi:hypothetical protein
MHVDWVVTWHLSSVTCPRLCVFHTALFAQVLMRDVTEAESVARVFTRWEEVLEGSAGARSDSTFCAGYPRLACFAAGPAKQRDGIIAKLPGVDCSCPLPRDDVSTSSGHVPGHIQLVQGRLASFASACRRLSVSSAQRLRHRPELHNYRCQMCVCLNVHCCVVTANVLPCLQVPGRRCCAAGSCSRLKRSWQHHKVSLQCSGGICKQVYCVDSVGMLRSLPRWLWGTAWCDAAAFAVLRSSV